MDLQGHAGVLLDAPLAARLNRKGMYPHPAHAREPRTLSPATLTIGDNVQDLLPSHRMISFITGEHKFQLRAAVVTVDEACVLLHRLDLRPTFLAAALSQPGLPFGHSLQRE